MKATYTVTFTASELQVTRMGVDCVLMDEENPARVAALERVKAKLADVVKPKQQRRAVA